MNEQLTYRDAGVDIDAGINAVEKMKDAIRRTHTPQVISNTGAFAGLFCPDFSGYQEPCLVSSIDGVGTKVSLACSMKRMDGVGRDLVNHCVNDILVCGASPLFFLDYFAVGRLNPDEAADAVRGVAEGCEANGCALIGGETAEMPGVYKESECDMAGCIVGVVDRNEILKPENVQSGDAIIGLASTGLHTNGYSLARAALLGSGEFQLDSYVPDLGQTLGDALLAPHKSYLNNISAARAAGISIRVMAHITGGGLYDNIPRVLPEDAKAAIDRRSWTPPPIFDLIQRVGNVPDSDMHRTFNMGLGMVIVVSRAQAPSAVQFFSERGDVAWQVGEIVKGAREVQII